jgi:truncated hemoglobin YjbI
MNTSTTSTTSTPQEARLSSEPRSVYEEVGGDAAAEALAAMTLRFVSEDHLLAARIPTGAGHQRKLAGYLKYALGGVPAYAGRPMDVAHFEAATEEGNGEITEADFRRLLRKAIAAMWLLDIDPDLIGIIARQLAGLADHVVTARIRARHAASAAEGVVP